MMTFKSTFSLLVSAVFSAVSATASAGGSDAAALDAALRFVRVRAPMRTRASATARSVTHHSAGAGEFCKVAIDGGGFVLTTASDAPVVIAYAPEGEMLPEDDGGPLWALVAADVAVRAPAPRAKAGAESLTAVPDLRVPPLVKSEWGQRNDSWGNRCYNYYTPRNWYCGCVATALSQLLRFHRYPADSVSAKTFTCCSNNVPVELTMMGGTYDWDSMPLVLTADAAEEQRMAIGRLTYDCGVAMRMHYSSGGSAALGGFEIDPLKNVFGYASAQSFVDDNGIDASVFEKCIYPNLDAGCPVLLGIAESNFVNGHAIIADGYGYSDGVLYTHLNMGWSGACDVWYNLPEVSAMTYRFAVLTSVVYNIFPTQTGEIISGRVLDCSGEPIAGASVSAAACSATTDTNGIYALRVPSPDKSASYVVTASFRDSTNTVAVSVTASSSPMDLDFETGDYYCQRTGLSCGNVWGADITLGPGVAAPEYVTVVVSAAGGETGLCSPVVGEHRFVKGTSVTLSAEDDGYAYAGNIPALRYPFAGFSGTGSVPAAGATNSVTFVADEDSTIEWRWSEAPSEALLYEETYLDDYGGWIDSYQFAWFPYGTNLTLTAASGPLGADEIAIDAEMDFTSTSGESEMLPLGTLKFITFMTGPLDGKLDWRNEGPEEHYRTPDSISVCMTNGLCVFYAYADKSSVWEDADGGVVPYWWYCKYLDGPNYYDEIDDADAAAAGDPDGDGFPNWREAAEGKVPMDDASFPFRIFSFSPGRIGFEGSQKGSLFVEGSPATGAPWSREAVLPASRTGVTNVVDFAVGTNRLFRVRHEMSTP